MTINTAAFHASSWFATPKILKAALTKERHRFVPAIYRKRYVMVGCMKKDPAVHERKWGCMKQCGACCKLDDYENDILLDMLKSEKDVQEYIDMIGENGWCKWFDNRERSCTIYEERPRFCRATPENFGDLYGVAKHEFDEFAISCCEFHIENTYGEESIEAFRFDTMLEDTRTPNL